MMRDDLVNELKNDLDKEKTIITLDPDDLYGTIYIAQKDGSDINCVEIDGYDYEDVLVKLLKRSNQIYKKHIKHIKESD